MIISVPALLIAAVLALVARVLLRDLLSPLRALPGPTLARYTRLWYLKALLRRDFHETNIRLHEQEGNNAGISVISYQSVLTRQARL